MLLFVIEFWFLVVDFDVYLFVVVVVVCVLYFDVDVVVGLCVFEVIVE